jgi:hypothetical protein
MNLVAPKAAAKHERLFNKLACVVFYRKGTFVEQMLVLNCCFRFNQIHCGYSYELVTLYCAT